MIYSRTPVSKFDQYEVESSLHERVQMGSHPLKLSLISLQVNTWVYLKGFLLRPVNLRLKSTKFPLFIS